MGNGNGNGNTSGIAGCTDYGEVLGLCTLETSGYPMAPILSNSLRSLRHGYYIPPEAWAGVDVRLQHRIQTAGNGEEETCGRRFEKEQGTGNGCTSVIHRTRAGRTLSPRDARRILAAPISREENMGQVRHGHNRGLLEARPCPDWEAPHDRKPHVCVARYLYRRPCGNPQGNTACARARRIDFGWRVADN